MSAKVKNIIIVGGVGVALILIYFFFIRQAPNQPALTTSLPTSSNVLPNTNTSNQNPSITQDFLSLLLSVKSIKLDDAVFSDLAFKSLADSSILLTPDGTEGRPNPFAPIGTDSIAPNPQTKTLKP